MGVGGLETSALLKKLKLLTTFSLSIWAVILPGVWKCYWTNIVLIMLVINNTQVADKCDVTTCNRRDIISYWLSCSVFHLWHSILQQTENHSTFNIQHHWNISDTLLSCFCSRGVKISGLAPKITTCELSTVQLHFLLQRYNFEKVIITNLSLSRMSTDCVQNNFLIWEAT